MRSSEVAQGAGVNPQTLRYYERRGLLKEIASLRSMRKALERLVDTCDQPRGSRECPLISTLQQPERSLK